MTLPLVPHSCRGDKAREGMRHLLFLTLATSDQIAPLGRARQTPSGFRSPDSPAVQTVCVQVSQACNLVCMCQHDARSALLAAIMQALPSRHMRSFLRAEFQTCAPALPTYLPACLSACTVNALFGYRCLRTTLFDLSALFGYERCINALFCHK